MDLVRGLVSKKKIRYVDKQHGFNLDLSYIPSGVPFPTLPIDSTYEKDKKPQRTQLIAMGFPSSGINGLYRNHFKDVKSYLESRHPSKYRLWNLCIERRYVYFFFRELEY